MTNSEASKAEEKGPKIVWAHCNKCLDKTKHEVVAERRQEGSEPYDEDIAIWWSTTYTLLECRGCETVCMRREFVFSEHDGVQVEYFPPAISRTRPPWIDELSKDEQEMLLEVYAALAADARRIATMGARTLVDMFILRKIGDQGGFEQKLKRLESEGFLSAKNREVLEAALEAGHASAHRGFAPDAGQLSTVMDIVENLLHSDLLNADAEALRKATPKRQRATGA
jgi:hypothetical protein